VKKPPSQSATSLPQAPRDDADSRFVKYAWMMAIRIACFVAMVLITPYGWYTWVLGAGAIFLPYFAVVVANVGGSTHRADAVNPERMLSSAAEPAPQVPPAATPVVLRISESPRPPRDPDAPA
jgi:hypothetical protein